MEAIRAVNQALGRIIRHKDDFGVVVLADSRFANLPQSVYPAWIRSSIRNENDSKHMFGEIRRFFTERSLLIEKSQTESSFKGSTMNIQRRRVNVMEDTRTKEECQYEAFLESAKMHGYGKVETKVEAPKSIPQTAKPNVMPQKRKFVVKVRRILKNFNFSLNF